MASETQCIKRLAEDLGARMLEAASERLRKEPQSPSSKTTVAAMSIAGLSMTAAVLVGAGYTREEAYATLREILATWLAQETANQ